jgi:hypothetical protein
MTFEWANDRVPQPSVGRVVRGALWNKHTALGSTAKFRYRVDGGDYGRIANALAARNPQVHLGHRAVLVEYRYRDALVSVVELVFPTKPFDGSLGFVRNTEFNALDFYDSSLILDESEFPNAVYI